MMRRQTNSAVHRWMNVLLLLDDGWPAERIAEALYIDAETVREHQRLYRSAGVTGLGRLTYAGREPDLTAARRTELSAELAGRLYMTSKEVCGFVRTRDGCRIRLVYPPPYAPNLNLIERPWWFFRKKTLWNEHYPTLAAFKAAIDRSFDDIAAYGAELAGLITDRFHFIGEESRTS